MRVERVVHAELALHVVKVVPADASETVGDRSEADPFGSPIAFRRVRRTNDLAIRRARDLSQVRSER
jgi:hypothetical protein